MQAIGYCTDAASGPSAYTLQETVGLAFVKEADYISCPTSGECPGKMHVMKMVGSGFRDHAGAKATPEGGKYAFTMTGGLFGHPWGGYLGMSGYLNTGSTPISTPVADVYTANPSPYGKGRQRVRRPQRALHSLHRRGHKHLVHGHSHVCAGRLQGVSPL